MHGWDDLQPRLNTLVRQGRLAEMPKLITDEVLAEFSVRGRFDEIADRLRVKYEGVVQRVGLYLPVVGGPREKEWEAVIRAL